METQPVPHSSEWVGLDDEARKVIAAWVAGGNRWAAQQRRAASPTPAGDPAARRSRPAAVDGSSCVDRSDDPGDHSFFRTSSVEPSRRLEPRP